MSTAVKKEHKSARPERGGQATMVEAIRQGIWEEMERDPTVFVIGEDVGAYGGAFKVTDGLIDRVWQRASDRYADLGRRDRRRGVWRGVDGHAAGRGVSVYRFHFRRLRSADELRCEVSLSLGRRIAGGISWSMWLGRALRTISLAECRSHFS